jgi:hypothetical protein
MARPLITQWTRLGCLCFAWLLGTVGTSAAGPAQPIGAASNPTPAGSATEAPATGISPTSEERPRETRYDRNLALCMSAVDGCNFDALTDEERASVLRSADER